MNRRLRALVDRALRPGTPARAAVSTVFDHVVMPLTPGPPVGLTGGPGRGGPDDPAVLVLLLGADDETAARRAAELAVARREVDVTPVFVVDTPVLATLRRAGYAVELLPPGAPRRAAALLECRRTYGTDAVLVLGGGPALDPAVLAGLVAPLRRPPRVPDRVGAALRRFERWYDAR